MDKRYPGYKQPPRKNKSDHFNDSSVNSLNSAQQIIMKFHQVALPIFTVSLGGIERRGLEEEEMKKTVSLVHLAYITPLLRCLLGDRQFVKLTHFLSISLCY